MAAAAAQEKIPQAWWFGSHYSSRQSPWLASTLSELEYKTKQMLNLVEADADSFAQRAEMYYKKRPLLLSMIEDFYRSHRSLAEQYDQLKSGSKMHHALFGPSHLDRSWSRKVSNNSSDGSSLFTSYSSDSDESEVDDPEQEETETECTLTDKSAKESESEQAKAMKGGELARMKEENAALRAELTEKDEEKREVIRQLTSSLDILKEENSYLRKCVKGSKKRNNLLEFKKLTKDILSGKLFGGGHCKTQTTVVAL
ncbi:protein NETWORKED 3C-like [Ananas comosus]|uniref:Protein NETWORKED 3C-like n=1 Tax=Ananas comosus TaxID=4615 RepID=A0A6P5GTF2_ANACO|nr:protein NETWORKED 3C-like [Ananas comosus]